MEEENGNINVLSWLPFPQMTQEREIHKPGGCLHAKKTARYQKYKVGHIDENQRDDWHQAGEATN